MPYLPSLIPLGIKGQMFLKIFSLEIILIIYVFLLNSVNNGYGECNIVGVWTELLVYIRKGDSCIDILRGKAQGIWSRERAWIWDI